MKLSGAIHRLEASVRVCGSPDATPADLRAALRATTELQSFVAARRAEIVRALDERPGSFPEATIAETSGCSLGEANRETERAATLDAAAAMADALSDGSITTGHVDALTRSGKRLGDQKGGLFDEDEAVANVAASSTVREFERWLKRRERALDRRDEEERLERQRRAARVRHWVDSTDGMWCLSGRFDPQTGVEMARLLDAATDRMRGEQVPASAPSDPVERDRFLRALAFAELMRGTGSAGAGAGAGSRPGPPLVVIDATQTSTVSTGSFGTAGGGLGGSGDAGASGASGGSAGLGPVLDWGYPVELPRSVLEELAGTTDPDVVVVANGVVLHAAGRLDLGRTSRLANRAQRRALAGLYATCAVPGCTAHYDRCRLHHVQWWRHGGRTDLSNLLPVCQHHHSRLHNDGWDISLGANRELRIRLPDGTIMSTGPPTRTAA